MAKKKTKELSPEERLQEALVPEEEWPYEVPGNWCWTKWGASGDFIAGSGFKNEYQGFTEYVIPFYKVGSLKYSDANGLIYDNSNTINEEMRLQLKASLIPAFSILFAKIGEAIRLNRRSINEKPCCIDNNMIAFVPKCLMRYAYFWSCGIDLYDYTNATTVPAIRKSDLEIIPFPLPPLPEQYRIVARIESLFAKLDEAKEAAQAVVDGFEDRKAAILHKAFTGELTREWREKNEISIHGWEQYKYGELGDSKLGKMLDKEKNVGRAVQYLRNINVRWFEFDLSDVLTMLATEEEINKLHVQDGDLFICEGGEPGRCAIWHGDECNMIFQKALHRFRPNEKVISDYICYYLYYLSVNNTLDKYFTGTTIKHLQNKDDWRPEHINVIHIQTVRQRPLTLKPLVISFTVLSELSMTVIQTMVYIKTVIRSRRRTIGSSKVLFMSMTR